MKAIIYVQLLEEGTKVYRPVPASKIKEGIYKLEGFDLYNPEDEIWEFDPGSIVAVEEQVMEGERVLVALKEQ